jgi:hypothetical protein
MIASGRNILKNKICNSEKKSVDNFNNQMGKEFYKPNQVTRPILGPRHLGHA